MTGVQTCALPICKRGADGEIVRYKARYVAKGFTQRPVRDFEQTYALTGTLPNL